MLVLLAAHLVAAIGAPVAVRRWGRRAFPLLALVPGAAFGWAVAQLGVITGGGAVTEEHGWVGFLHLDVALRMNRLSWLLVLLVSGIGALVLVYCARYFEDGQAGLGRFAGLFTGFAGAMFGLVVSDNLIVLYVFWELTTIFSYLLIGHDPTTRANRLAAGQALFVTTAGGLVMLVGLVLLGERAGTYRLSRIIASPPDGSVWLSVALVLILIGALSKSAIFPTSFWLPSAMVAPTPVSAYLHAAAMVKAGVYLVAQLAPAFATLPPWHPLVYAGGVATMIFGGWAALRQHDLKLLLAYGTVSQLGFLFAVTGSGTPAAALAGLAMVLAHALFKSALFLVTGVVDHRAGSRDLRQLSGLWRAMPVTFAVACLAAASMAGLPPLLGFVAKESSLAVFTHGGPVDLAVLAGVTVGSAFTVAYTARFLWGAFAGKPDTPATAVGPPDPLFPAVPCLLAVAGLALGLGYAPLDRVLAADPDLPRGEHLALWHGATPALLLSATAVAAGLLLFAFQHRVARAARRLRAPRDGGWVYGRLVGLLDGAAVELTAATQRGSMPTYLATILGVLVLAPGTAAVAALAGAPPARLTGNAAEVLVGLVLMAAAGLAVWSRHRMAAMLFTSITGYGTAVFLVLRGAPDVALTQFLVETVSIVIFVLVLRRLPAYFSTRLRRSDRWLRRGLGLLVGLATAVMAGVAVGARRAPSISSDFPAAAVGIGGGRNVVNVTLVDIRAWDTLGEIAVLVVAATGVASLVFLRPRIGPRPRRGHSPVRGGPAARVRSTWLSGAGALPSARRSVIFEVVTRLLFHIMVLYSLYLLVSGHNAPGGGFAGGLVVGLALTIRYLAGGGHELTEAVPLDAGLVLGAGLTLATGSAVVPLLATGHALDSVTVALHLGPLGDPHLVTSIFFDIGVYLVVVGLAIDMLRSLGAEVDRRAEPAGAARGGAV